MIEVTCMKLTIILCNPQADVYVYLEQCMNCYDSDLLDVWMQENACKINWFRHWAMIDYTCVI